MQIIEHKFIVSDSDGDADVNANVLEGFWVGRRENIV